MSFFYDNFLNNSKINLDVSHSLPPKANIYLCVNHAQRMTLWLCSLLFALSFNVKTTSRLEFIKFGKRVENSNIRKCHFLLFPKNSCWNINTNIIFTICRHHRFCSDITKQLYLAFHLINLIIFTNILLICFINK